MKNSDEKAKNELILFLKEFPEFNAEDISELANKINVQYFKKGSFLLKEGDVYGKCFFVLKGCVRQFYLIDGEEKTTNFFMEREAIISFTDYLSKSLSDHYLVCLEDCFLVVGDLNQEQAMYDEFPKLLAITRWMTETDFGKTQHAFNQFISSGPEKRYLDLIANKPNLVLRVPQQYLASYIGITPESLSRLKGRIRKKSKSSL